MTKEIRYCVKICRVLLKNCSEDGLYDKPDGAKKLQEELNTLFAQFPKMSKDGLIPRYEATIERMLIEY